MTETYRGILAKYMLEFDFMVDRDMRASLESDWKELQVAFENGAWKTVHVLAGSIVEAVLVDHLMSISFQGKDPLKMSLDEAIGACKAEGILSDKVVELSTVIRRFRNLIHPGRAVRLEEVPDKHGATVAQSLVHMILNEIASAKRKTYGYTAEQLASKVERDSSSVAILSHLLKKTNDREIARLLLEVLPERYGEMELQDEPDSCRLTIEKTFHSAFEAARPETKKSVARRFVKVLHEEDGSTVSMYERVFFRSGHLEYLDFDDVRVVKQHLVAVLKASPTKALFNAAFGIGKYLVKDEVADFVDVAVQVILNPPQRHFHTTCETFIRDLYNTLPAGHQEAVNKRLNEWVHFLTERNRDQDADRVKALVIDDLPF